MRMNRERIAHAMAQIQAGIPVKDAMEAASFPHEERREMK